MYSCVYTYIHIYILKSVLRSISSAWSDKITLYIPGYVHCLYMFAKPTRAGYSSFF